VDGRKAQDDRSVETEDESVTGSVFLFNVVNKRAERPSPHAVQRAA
jgi:hypothetical protein